jgi:hypothetical protein
MAENGMAIYVDVSVPIVHKIFHIHKIGGKLHRDFTKDFGDVPVCRLNSITQKMEMVVNPRGLSYAARTRKEYHKTKRQILSAINYNELM